MARDQQRVERSHKTSDLLEDAIFKTVKAAVATGDTIQPRRESRAAWRAFAERIIELDEEFGDDS